MTQKEARKNAAYQKNGNAEFQKGGKANFHPRDANMIR